MLSPGLANKLRPTTYAEVIGQAAAIKVLAPLTDRKPVDRPHAILFHGPSGTGKTTLARIFKDELGCADADFEEINGAKTRGIDDMRQIQSRMNLAPMAGRCRVWLLDECHQLTKEAQSGLLKTLEDTPRHVYFLLCTTDPHKVLPTIKTRCLEVGCKAVSAADLTAFVAKAAKGEGIKIAATVAAKIVTTAEGSPRKALVLLDTIREIPDEDGQLEAVAATDVKAAAFEIARALMQPGKGWKEVAGILKPLKEQEEDPEGLRRMILGYCNSVLINGTISGRAFNIIKEFQRNFFDTGWAGLTAACFAVVVPPTK